MPNSAAILGPDGPFNSQLPWFSVRECQLQMAQTIEDCIQQKNHLVAESGTGTGKTYAYLVPALLEDAKIIVSTRTKYLQEQLFQKDISTVCDILNIEPNVRVLKGRSNYFCLLRYERTRRQQDLFMPVSKLDRIAQWVENRGNGDISEYPGISTDMKSKITSTKDNCVGSQCEFWGNCYVNRAKIEARSADILVVNHSLLCFSILNSEEGETEGLMGADVIIVDEAHRFPEIAANALGISLTTADLASLRDNILTACEEGMLDTIYFGQKLEDIFSLWRAARKLLNSKQSKAQLSEVSEDSNFIRVYLQMVGQFEKLAQELIPYIAETTEIENCFNQTLELIHNAKYLIEINNEESASWYETKGEDLKLSTIPLEPGKKLSPILEQHEGSWIFTSATLAVGDDFSYFKNRIGLSSAISDKWNSPFKFEQQSLIYFPPGLPDPNHPSFDEKISATVEQVVRSSQGRAFVLFTSYKSLHAVRDLLQNKLPYRLLCQGTDSSQNLLEQFKEDGNAVLLGTSTFWEGVDVQGEALSCVIIAKLPFLPPNDPVMIARENFLKASGVNPFWNWQVPTAALTLKQGAGRLIRSINDRGVLVLCDPRILQKAYGRTFIESLPPIPKTQNFDLVDRFFSS